MKFQIIEGSFKNKTSDILFDRPINKLYQQNIVLCFEHRGFIKQISDIFQVIKVLNHNPVVVTEKINFLKNFISDFTLLPERNSKSFSNADLAIELINNCRYCIIGSQDLSSRWEIFYEKVIQSSQPAIVFTTKTYQLAEYFVTNNVKRKGDIFVFKFADFLNISSKLYNSPIKKQHFYSVHQKLELLNNISRELSVSCFSIDEKQLLVTSYLSPNKALIANYKKTEKNKFDLDFIGLIISFLADANITEKKFLDICVAAIQVYKYTKLKSENLAYAIKNSL